VHVLVESICSTAAGQLHKAVLQVVEDTFLENFFFPTQLQDQAMVTGDRSVQILRVGREDDDSTGVRVHQISYFEICVSVDAVLGVETTIDSKILEYFIGDLSFKIGVED
jgi:hypothetical protein